MNLPVVPEATAISISDITLKLVLLTRNIMISTPLVAKHMAHSTKTRMTDLLKTKSTAYW